MYAHQKEEDSDSDDGKIKHGDGDSPKRNKLDLSTDKEDFEAKILESLPKESKSDNQKAEVELKPVGLTAIMKYYNPKWVAYLALFIALINSFGYPIYGFIFTKILYVLL